MDERHIFRGLDLCIIDAAPYTEESHMVCFYAHGIYTPSKMHKRTQKTKKTKKTLKFFYSYNALINLGTKVDSCFIPCFVTVILEKTGFNSPIDLLPLICSLETKQRTFDWGRVIWFQLWIRPNDQRQVCLYDDVQTKERWEWMFFTLIKINECVFIRQRQSNQSGQIWLFYCVATNLHPCGACVT